MKYDAPCSGCGQMLPGTPKSLPAGQRMCHACRRDRRNQLRAEAVIAARAPRKTKLLLCPCGSEFMGYPSAKYCGPSCRQPAALTLRAAALAFRLTFAPNCIEPGCTEPARKRLMCCTHYNRHYQPNRSRGTSFAEWKRQNPERAVVQEERKRRRRRARQREAVTEPYTLAEIAARDRFICGLCRRRVDMGKSHPHPKSPSIDHKVPISESLDDTRANVQLAHFDCNWRKGARGADEQLFLFG